MKRPNLKLEINNLEYIEKISIIITAILTGLGLLWTMGSTMHDNVSQDNQWEASYMQQNSEITELQNTNKSLTNLLLEQQKQNETLQDEKEELQELVNELKKQNEISENHLEMLLSEKGIQCRVSYLCCRYDSLWSLRNELKQDTVLIVNNNLSQTLGLEYIENAEPYDYPESYLKLQEELGGPTSTIIVFLKVDLTSNSTVLTQDLVLNISEVNFPEMLPIALSKLSMYAESTGSDHQGILHDVEQYNGVIEETAYTFSDQIISDKKCTTILCPVMVQVASDETEDTGLLTRCTSTYKYISIPESISFTDVTTNQTIIKTIRDINDSAAITEYRTVIGYG